MENERRSRIKPGAYVRILYPGPYYGLYGWVRWIAHDDDGRVYDVAVEDRPDGQGSWRVFPLRDVVVELGGGDE